MATFRSRNGRRGRDDGLGVAHVVDPDLTEVISALAEATVYLPCVQRPARVDRPLLPVWLFKSLVAGVFAVVYGLILLGLYLLYRILLG